METYYTTNGSVRGSCGHKHRLLETAQKCVYQDHKGCISQGGYSDRSVCVIKNGEERPLNEVEFTFLDNMNNE
jgi:hypothetical protein